MSASKNLFILLACNANDLCVANNRSKVVTKSFQIELRLANWSY